MRREDERESYPRSSAGKLNPGGGRWFDRTGWSASTQQSPVHPPGSTRSVKNACAFPREKCLTACAPPGPERLYTRVVSHHRADKCLQPRQNHAHAECFAIVTPIRAVPADGCGDLQMTRNERENPRPGGPLDGVGWFFPASRKAPVLPASAEPV